MLESVCQRNLLEKFVLCCRVVASMATINGSNFKGNLSLRPVGITSFVVLHRDGKTLASGGRSNLLHLWCLESRQLMRVVQMPPRVRTVRHLEFLPDSFDGGSSQVLSLFSLQNKESWYKFVPGCQTNASGGIDQNTAMDQMILNKLLNSVSNKKQSTTLLLWVFWKLTTLSQTTLFLVLLMYRFLESSARMGSCALSTSKLLSSSLRSAPSITP